MKPSYHEISTKKPDVYYKPDFHEADNQGDDDYVPVHTSHKPSRPSFPGEILRTRLCNYFSKC